MDELESQSKLPERTVELSPRKWLILRLIVALVFGGAILFFTLRAGYDAAKAELASPFMSQAQTEMNLKILIATIAEYQRKHDVLPRTLDQLQHDPALSGVSTQDAWGHPFAYTIQGDEFSVTSYGQDGKPGGTGWDSDLTWTSGDGSFRETHSLPTVRQYLTAPVMRDTVETAIFTGILAAVLCFVSLKPRPLTRWSIAGLILQTGVIFVASVLVGGIITAFHIPSGH